MTALAACLLIFITTAAVAQDKPLPAAADLRSLALKNFTQSQKARELYLCTERIANSDLDSKGAVKKTNSVDREIFFVNGYQISQTVSHNGQALSADAQRKRDEAVQQAIHSATGNHKPKEAGLVINAGDVVRMAKLEGERRIQVAGRPTIVFNVVSDPSAKAGTMEQKIMRVMEGTVSIDEATGSIQDINTHGVRDIKLGGGLLANVHKGFRMHMQAAPQPDGVWLLTLAEGTGNARVGLFLNEGVAFRQETLGCKVYDVTSEATINTKK